jgi:membrane-bound serine protease (ClpP class)
MKYISYRVVFYSLLIGLSSIAILFAEPSSKAPTQSIIYKLNLEGAITPSSLDLLSEALDKAEDAKASALLVSMDTPGGLMTSMDKMIRRILSSPIPVITYISPKGAACGSAGVYILYASHLAAMSPATNIGSATPVQMGGNPDNSEKSTPMEKSDSIPEKAGVDDQVNLKRKLINHAVAQIKSLALYHGRDPIFAERSITHAENITADDALKKKVIEIIAEDDTDLLKKINGRTVRMVTGNLKLEITNPKIVLVENDFRQNILKFLTDPNIAYLLMMIGTLGILAEVQYPGAIFPGVAGAICLILGLYAMHTISLSYAGFGLIITGIICFILEVSIVSYGMLTIAGIVSMVIGSIMLSDSGDAMAKVSINIALSTALTVGMLSAFLVFKSSQMLKKKPRSGNNLLLDHETIADSDIDSKTGQIFINSEIWSARCLSGIIEKGSLVKVIRREGLILFVEKIEK